MLNSLISVCFSGLPGRLCRVDICNCFINLLLVDGFELFEFRCG